MRAKYILYLLLFVTVVCNGQWVQPYPWIRPSAWVDYVGVYGGTIVVDTFAVFDPEIWWGVTYISTDNDTAWYDAGILSSTHVAFDGSTMFVGTSSPGTFGVPSVRLYRRTNAGSPWQNISPFSDATTNMSFLRTLDSAVFVSVGRFFRSFDNGDHWSDLTNRLPGFVATLAWSGGRLIAGCSLNPNSFFSYSNDRGETWTSAGSFPGFVNETAIIPQTVGNDLLFAGTWDRGLYRSMDRGLTWTAINNGVADTQVTHLEVSGTNLFAVTQNGTLSRIYLSSDAGDHWRTVDDGLPPGPYLSVAVDTTFLYVGTRYGGLWRRPLIEITTALNNIVASAFPSEVTLAPNYPNPFNPSTTISFSIPRSTYTTLKIYNTLGQEIATLVSDDLRPGTYSKQWNPTNVASGVYYYRLTAGDFVQTKKLLLLR